MSTEDSVISVSTLNVLYANSLSSTIDGQLISLEGFYSDNKRDAYYGKYYYDEILDKDKKHKVTAQIIASDKKKLVSGNYYQFQGFLKRAQSLDNNSGINVYFTVSKILKHEKEVQIISKAEYDIIRARFDRDFPFIQDVLLKKIENGKKPVLDIITGIQSTSTDDYSNQLENKEYFHIRHHKCNLSSKDGILELLDKFDFTDSDLLILLRGGGSGLEVFDEIELCKRVIELPVPFITGIGHDEDKTLLQRVSDLGLSTPTAVGAYLQKITDFHKKRLWLVERKDLEMERHKKRLDGEKSVLVKQISLLKKSLIIVSIIVVLFIAVVCYFFFYRNS